MTTLEIEVIALFVTLTTTVVGFVGWMFKQHRKTTEQNQTQFLEQVKMTQKRLDDIQNKYDGLLETRLDRADDMLERVDVTLKENAQAMCEISAAGREMAAVGKEMIELSKQMLAFFQAQTTVVKPARRGKA